jgi:hypothetical protein
LGSLSIDEAKALAHTRHLHGGPGFAVRGLMLRCAVVSDFSG